MEDSFEIYVDAVYRKPRKRCFWATTTVANAKRGYTVEFEAEAPWVGLPSAMMRAVTKALADLEVDGRQVTIYIPRFFQSEEFFATMQQIASGQSPDSAGSGPVWGRFLFQMQRHNITVVPGLPEDKHSKSLDIRLDRWYESRLRFRHL